MCIWLLVSCGSGTQSADEQGEAPTAVPADAPSTTEPAVSGSTSSTVASTVATTSADESRTLTWSPPVRVDDPRPDDDGPLGLGLSFQSPSAASELGVVLAQATPRGEGIEAATRLWFSEDALNWDAIDLGGVRLRSVTAGGPGFVAIGREDTSDPGPETQAGIEFEPVPAVWISDDGREWASATSIDRGAFDHGEMADVVATGGGLMAVGDVWDSGGPIHPAVWTSPDGLSWSMIPDDPFGTTDGRLMMQLAAGEGGIVAVGQAVLPEGDGPGPVSAWWSSDGTRWEPADVGSFGLDLAIGDLIGFGRGFALGASRGAQDPLVWVSSDGRTWGDPIRLPTRPETDSSFVDGLATDESVLIAVGDDVVFDESHGPATGGASIWMSSDGVDWTQVPPEELEGDALLDNVDATSVLRLDDRWIVLGTTWDDAEEDVAGAVWFST